MKVALRGALVLGGLMALAGLLLASVNVLTGSALRRTAGAKLRRSCGN